MNIAVGDVIWKRFSTKFKFRPSVDPAHFPGISEPSPSVTYDVSEAFETELTIQKAEADLRAQATRAWCECVSVGTRLAVLDWQHVDYWWVPHEADGDPNWMKPVLP